MNILDIPSQRYRSVKDFGSHGVEAAEVANGAGDAHFHVLRIEPGGAIGPHQAGFGQLFMILGGRGWVAGEDGIRVSLAAGQAAYIRKGEVHSKGADEAVVCLVLQVTELGLTQNCVR